MDLDLNLEKCHALNDVRVRAFSLSVGSVMRHRFGCFGADYAPVTAALAKLYLRLYYTSV
jgi:hypothetical protein